MFGTTFSHGTLKKLVVYFGTLFNDIHINRYDSSNALIQNLKVPLQYGPREKFLSRALGNPDLNREIAIQLPVMSYQMVNFQYDASRAKNKLNKISVPVTGSPGTKSYQYSPVPYDITFELSIMTKSAEDGTFILEQILPYFTPTWSAAINIDGDINQSFDVPLSLNDVTHIDTYEGNYEQRRALIWNLTFTMKAWFFGPTKTGGKIIQEIDLGFHVPPIGMSISDAFSTHIPSNVTIEITPGLTANGQSVNWYGSANAAIRPSSVAANTISANTHYGFMTDFTSDT